MKIEIFLYTYNDYIITYIIKVSVFSVNSINNINYYIITLNKIFYQLNIYLYMYHVILDINFCFDETCFRINLISL